MKKHTYYFISQNSKTYSFKAESIILYIGGYAYSVKHSPWNWLTSKNAAEAMAEKVAEWPAKYNCDGIDLDLEDGAGNRSVYT